MATKTTPFYMLLCVSSANERRNPRDISGFAMRALLPPPITAHRIRIAAVRRRSHSSVVGTASNSAMADESDPKINGSGKSPLNEEKQKKEEEAKVKVPTPPEKPLPGDCCGNGCIPCVWDTYYEELEDYNKLVAKSKS